MLRLESRRVGLRLHHAASIVGKAAVRIGSQQLLLLRKVIREVTRVRSSGYADLLLCILRHSDLPGAAPSQRAKPDIPDNPRPAMIHSLWQTRDCSGKHRRGQS
jgi:hypothetical protein